MDSQIDQIIVQLPRSLWNATEIPASETRQLDSDVDCDVAIVSCEFTDLHAGLSPFHRFHKRASN